MHILFGCCVASRACSFLAVFFAVIIYCFIFSKNIFAGYGETVSYTIGRQTHKPNINSPNSNKKKKNNNHNNYKRQQQNMKIQLFYSKSKDIMKQIVYKNSRRPTDRPTDNRKLCVDKLTH